MKICQKCHNEFSPITRINGVRKGLYNRIFCLKCSPFGEHNTTQLRSITPCSTIDRLSSEDFLKLIQSSSSRSDVFSRLKLRKSGSSFKILNRRLKKENVDVSHFIPFGRTGGKRKRSDDYVYTKHSQYRSIRQRVISDALFDYKCFKCHIGNQWNGDVLTLELDHVNGDRYDNRKDNLRWLCPNCHSQTKTYGTKSRGKNHLTFHSEQV